MPQFFLHLDNGQDRVTDEEGSTLPDLDAARAEAISGIRSIVSDEVHQGQLSLEGQIEIADADGQVLDVVRYDEAVTVKSDPQP